MNVSILVPVHNESEILKENSKQILSGVKKFDLFDDFEILLCDNGSTDKTLEIGKSISGSYKNINIVHVREKGIGHGLRAGIKAARHEFLVFYPIDLSFNLSFISESVSKLLEENLDIVIGSKGHKDSVVSRPFVRELFSKIFNILIYISFGLKIKDTQGTLTFKKSQAKKFLDKIKSNDLFFTVELLAYAQKNDLKIVEIPVTVEDMRKSSKINPLKDGIKAFIKIMKSIWRIRVG